MLASTLINQRVRSCSPSFSTRFTASSFGPPFLASLGRAESYDRGDRGSGCHTLRLLFADFAHVPHNPPVYSEAINVTVTESGRPPKKRYKRHRRLRYY